MSRPERPQLVVWSHGEALLAAPLDAVVEVVAVDDGVAHGRSGELEPRPLPGLPAATGSRAVVLRTPAGLRALPADEVDGVRTPPGADAQVPTWLRAVAPEVVDRLVRLDDGRVAAILAVDALDAGP
jgi:hypothetical protein